MSKFSLTMVHNLSTFYLFWRVNVKSFVNHGAQFKYFFTHLRRVNVKIFVKHGAQFKYILHILASKCQHLRQPWCTI